MGEKTRKDAFGSGYTTQHENGTKSKSLPDVFGNGYTTYHEDGSKSKTVPNVFGGGYTTYHENGGKSKTVPNVFGGGYTTYHKKKDSDTTQLTPSDVSWDGPSSYSTAYLSHESLDFSLILLALIGGAIVFCLYWLYTGKEMILPPTVFCGILLLCLIGTGSRKGQPYFWAWLYYVSSTGLVMLMANNRNFDTSSFPSILIWLAPFGVGFVIGFVANMLGYEDRFPLLFLPYLLMGITWFLSLYKNYHGRPVFTYSLKAEKIVFLAFALLSLLLSVREARRQKRLYSS